MAADRRLYTGKCLVSTLASFLATLLAISVGACLAAGVGRAAFPGRNGEIAYGYYLEAGDSYTSGAVFSVCPDGSRSRTLISGESAQDRPAFSPDGLRLAMSTGGSLFVARYDGRQRRSVIPPPVATTGVFTPDTSPDWSSDGRSLIFERQGPSGHSIQALVGGSISEIAKGLYPVWSARGRIAFAVPEGRKRAVHVLARVGGASHRLVSGSQPDWSPSGRRLVYRTPRGEIALIASDGSRRRSLKRRGGSQAFRLTGAGSPTRITPPSTSSEPAVGARGA